ncbi:MAG: lipopolysaccharide biosynthesis protein [Tenuifilaceae bacterium]
MTSTQANIKTEALDTTPNLKENLHQRAYLNAITGGLDFGTKQVVGFFLNPIMVSILGPFYYGVWKVIGQLSSYMNLSDLRASQPLAAILSKERTTRKQDELKKLLSTAFYVIFLSLPLFILGAIILIWISPFVTGVEEQYYIIVRVTTAVLTISFIINQPLSVFDSTIVGMNLSYKRMGIRAIVTLVGGVLTAGALYMGYGLIGISAVQIVISLLTTITLWYIVKKSVPWFGFVKVKFKDTISFIKLSGWFMLWKYVKIAEQSVDVILLSVFAGPKYVASYAISKFLMNSANGGIVQIISSVLPGIGKFMGEKDYNKLLLLRKQMMTIILLVGTLLGFVICLLNKSFVTIWTNDELFAGQIETLLIVLIGIIQLLQGLDGSFINLTLDLRKKIIITGFSALVSIILSIILIPIFKTLGLLVALLVSKIILSVGYAMIVGKALESKNLLSKFVYSKLMVFCALTLIGGVSLGYIIKLSGWFELLFVTSFSFVFIATFFWFFALADNRVWIIEFYQKIKFNAMGKKVKP